MNETERFIVGAILAALVLRFEPSPPRSLAFRRAAPGRRTPGGKGRSFGQRMGSRRTSS